MVQSLAKYMTIFTLSLTSKLNVNQENFTQGDINN